MIADESEDGAWSGATAAGSPRGASATGDGGGIRGACRVGGGGDAPLRFVLGGGGGTAARGPALEPTAAPVGDDVDLRIARSWDCIEALREGSGWALATRGGPFGGSIMIDQFTRGTGRRNAYRHQSHNLVRGPSGACFSAGGLLRAALSVDVGWGPMWVGRRHLCPIGPTGAHLRNPVCGERLRYRAAAEPPSHGPSSSG